MITSIFAHDQANYKMVCREGNLLFLSGHLPITTEGELVTGRLGEGARACSCQGLRARARAK